MPETAIHENGHPGAGEEDVRASTGEAGQRGVDAISPTTRVEGSSECELGCGVASLLDAHAPRRGVVGSQPAHGVETSSRQVPNNGRGAFSPAAESGTWQGCNSGLTPWQACKFGHLPSVRGDIEPSGLGRVHLHRAPE